MLCNNTRNFTYDALSRLTLSEDLHDSADTGFASTTYAYDSAGNITSRQDGKLQTVTYAYDDINRVLTEDYAGEAGAEIEYGYDSCSEGIGRLCSATTTDAIANFSYNALGNVSSETKTIDGTNYSTTYSYDRQGNIVGIVLPDLSTVAYRFNSAGLLETVEVLPTSTTTLGSYTVSNINYAPTGAVTARVFGNGDVSLYTYDEDALYRLSNITTLTGTTTPYDGTNPAVTVGATNVQKDGATLVGALADMMGASSVTLGFRYGLLLDDDDPWTATTTTLTASSTGPFSVSLLGLDAFKDYSYEAFMSTSSTAVYYGGRHRFYTADLTMSMPVYKEHNRAWVLRTYDNDGTHASTTVDGNKLKLANQGSTTTPSYVSGYWLSNPWDLSSITNVENSFIEYCACARNGADVTVKVAVTTSTSTEPSASDFTVATTTTTIPGITAGDNLYGKYLWLKIEMEPNWTATGTPCLCRINLAINDVGTTTSAHNALQSLTYTYDAVGNITQVKDLSGFGGHKTVNYTYDDLYRLLTASTTVPANGGYNQTFTYDRIGDILTGPQGSYAYAETGFANPHASTQIGSQSLTYDNNGNVTDFGNDDYVWNYRDRLTKSVVGSNTTFYGYDHKNIRVLKGDGMATTTYIGKYYETTNATTTKYVFDNNGILLATIEGTGTATSTKFVHGDHLNSTTITVDEDGDVVSTKDYLPFGSERVNTGEPIGRAFIGEYSDTETSLNYLQQRYYSGDNGKFLSQDTAFLAVGTPNLTEIIARADGVKNPYVNSSDIKETDREVLGKFLSNPQLANAYSYGRNNPITMSDPNGEFGVFLQGDISGNAGLFSGFAGMGSVGGGFTVGNPFADPIDVGGYTSYGGLVGGTFHSTTLEGSVSSPNNYGVFGLSGGASAGVTLTNATRMSQLSGPGITNTLNVGIGTISWSRSESGIWTVTIAIGAKPAISFSTYPTETKTATVITTEKKNDKE